MDAIFLIMSISMMIQCYAIIKLSDRISRLEKIAKFDEEYERDMKAYDSEEKDE